MKTRKDEILQVMLREARHHMERLSDLENWLDYVADGELTFEEARDEVPKLLSRIQALIVPSSTFRTWQDPADGWSQIQEESPQNND